MALELKGVLVELITLVNEELDLLTAFENTVYWGGGKQKNKIKKIKKIKRGEQHKGDRKAKRNTNS